jgi:hypothetical protein
MPNARSRIIGWIQRRLTALWEDGSFRLLLVVVAIIYPAISLGTLIADRWQYLEAGGGKAAAWIAAGIVLAGWPIVYQWVEAGNKMACFATLERSRNPRRLLPAWRIAVKLVALWCILVAATLFICLLAGSWISTRNIAAGFGTMRDNLMVALFTVGVCTTLIFAAQKLSWQPVLRFGFLLRFVLCTASLLLIVYASFVALFPFLTEHQLAAFVAAAKDWHEKNEQLSFGLDLAAVTVLLAIMFVVVQAREQGLAVLRALSRTQQLLAAGGGAVFFIALIAVSAEPPLIRDAKARLDEIRVAQNEKRVDDINGQFLERVARLREAPAPAALQRQTALLLGREFEEEYAASSELDSARESSGVADRIHALALLHNDPRVRRLFEAIARSEPLSAVGRRVAAVLEQNYSHASTTFWRAAATMYHPEKHSDVDKELHVEFVTQAVSLALDHSITIGGSMLDMFKSSYLTMVGEGTIARSVNRAFDAFSARVVTAGGNRDGRTTPGIDDLQTAEDERAVGQAMRWICDAPNTAITRTRGEIRIADDQRLDARTALATVVASGPDVRPGVDRPTQTVVEEPARFDAVP